jgi:hypothetical protein
LSWRARLMVSFSGITSYVRGRCPELVASSESCLTISLDMAVEL